MMAGLFDRVPGMDQDGFLPDVVRQRMAESFEDPATPEGTALSRTFVGISGAPVTIPAGLSWPSGYDPEIASVTDLPGGGAAARVGVRPRDMFDAVSTARTAPAATYYVATTGNDSTGNGSVGQPFRSVWKGIQAANAGGVPAMVHVLGGIYERGFQPGHTDIAPTVDMALVANGRVMCGTFDFPAAPVVDGTYESTYSWSLAGADRIVSTDVLNSDGLYTDLVQVASPVIVNSTPGTWCIAAGKVYVRRQDGSAPSSSNTRVYRNGMQQTIRVTNHVNVYVGGLNDISGWDCEGGLSSPLNAYISAAPSADKILAVENSTFRYGGGALGGGSKGVRVDTWRGLAYFYNCASDGNITDGFNVHNTNGADGVRMLTVNCSGTDNGRKGAVSCNGLTNHEDCTIIDVAGVYRHNRGGSVACIDESRSYLAGTVVSDDLGDIALGGSQVPTGIRTADASEMWCERTRVVLPSGLARAYEARGTSKIHRRNVWPTAQADAKDSGAVIDAY